MPPIKRYGFVLLIAAASAFGGCDGRTNVPEEATEFAEPVYVIEGNSVHLDDGVYSGEDGTVSLLKSVRADLNDDTLDDLAAVLVLDSKGSGIFYYLNVFLADRGGRLSLVGTQFLGEQPGLYITRHWKVSEGKLLSLESY